MTAALDAFAKPAIIGRSSSHFTRVVRIFATELRVDHSFQIVPDLMSSDPRDYGGNPALKLPTLKTARGDWFGALGICRELSRQANEKLRIVWPEDLESPLLSNTQELVVQAMTTEVTLIMAKLSRRDADTHQVKMTSSLVSMMSWLESNAGRALAALPSERDLSYLEVTLFSLVTHLEFRGVLPVSEYRDLNGFCRHFAGRSSAAETMYRFDT